MAYEEKAGSSHEQQAAEALMIAALAETIGQRLSPRRFAMPDGSTVDVDGSTDDASVLVEALAHQGRSREGQVRKVTSDAFKLAFVGEIVSAKRRIVLMSDPEAARRFRGRSWRAEAFRHFGVEIVVVDLPPEIVEGLRKAQVRQFR